MIPSELYQVNENCFSELYKSVELATNARFPPVLCRSTVIAPSHQSSLSIVLFDYTRTRWGESQATAIFMASGRLKAMLSSVLHSLFTLCFLHVGAFEPHTCVKVAHTYSSD